MAYEDDFLQVRGDVTGTILYWPYPKADPCDEALATYQALTPQQKQQQLRPSRNTVEAGNEYYVKSCGSTLTMDALLGPAPTLTGELITGFTDGSGRLTPSLETLPNGKRKVRSGSTLAAPEGYFNVFTLNSGQFILDLDNDSQNIQEFDPATQIDVQLRMLPNGTPPDAYDNGAIMFGGVALQTAITQF